MDTTPFLEIDLENLKDSYVEELKKFHKSYFNVGNILNTASELKHLSELKSQIREEFNNPSSEFVKLFTKKVYEGTVTQKVVEQFTELMKRSLNGYVNEIISERLNVAIKVTEEPKVVDEIVQPAQDDVTLEETSRIITTDEELQGFYIVRAILAKEVSLDRIHQRDTQSYFTILFDNNNRKPICKLHFNSKNKYIETFNVNKQSEKHKIESIVDIYQYADELIHITEYYLSI